MKISTNHIILQSQLAMRAICKPLLKYTPWIFFDYERFYDDGTWFNINTTDPEVIFNYTQEDMFLNREELQRRVNSIDVLSNCETAKSQLNDAPVLLNDIRLHVEHNLDNRVYSYSRKQNYYEVCGFGLGGDGSISPAELARGFYQNSKTLNQFVSYFLLEAKELLQEVEYNRLMLPVVDASETAILQPQLDCSQLAQYLINQPLRINDVALTSAETNCLIPYAKGRSAKEIALANGNSYRTIEKHIDNIKKKLCVNSREALAQLMPKHLL